VLRKAALGRDFHPVPLGVTLSTSFKSEVKKKSTGNVLALLPGSDPELSKQWVIVTAHHDHLGRKTGVKPGDDDIYNGAVDNASGVAALLCLAEAFVRLGTPPDRSIIFVATTAEEPGLFGSDYFVRRGPIPSRQLAAAINIDGATLMVHPLRDVVAMGAPESTLGDAARSAARSRGLELRSEELPLVGSDHFPFAKACVPALWVIAGQKTGRPDLDGAKLEAEWMATRLHSPKDDMAQPLDFEAAADLAAFDFELGRVVANGRNAPTWHEETIVRRFLEQRAGGRDCTR
jgi:Zn-dependent M28 family amino/carboxypeptidase